MSSAVDPYRCLLIDPEEAFGQVLAAAGYSFTRREAVSLAFETIERPQLR